MGGPRSSNHTMLYGYACIAYVLCVALNGIVENPDLFSALYWDNPWMINFNVIATVAIPYLSQIASFAAYFLLMMATLTTIDFLAACTISGLIIRGVAYAHHRLVTAGRGARIDRGTPSRVEQRIREHKEKALLGASRAESAEERLHDAVLNSFEYPVANVSSDLRPTFYDPVKALHIAFEPETVAGNVLDGEFRFDNERDAWVIRTPRNETVVRPYDWNRKDYSTLRCKVQIPSLQHLLVSATILALIAWLVIDPIVSSNLPLTAWRVEGDKCYVVTNVTKQVSVPSFLTLEQVPLEDRGISDWLLPNAPVYEHLEPSSAEILARMEREHPDVEQRGLYLLRYLYSAGRSLSVEVWTYVSTIGLEADLTMLTISRSYEHLREVTCPDNTMLILSALVHLRFGLPFVIVCIVAMTIVPVHYRHKITAARVSPNVSVIASIPWVKYEGWLSLFLSWGEYKPLSVLRPTVIASADTKTYNLLHVGEGDNARVSVALELSFRSITGPRAIEDTTRNLSLATKSWASGGGISIALKGIGIEVSAADSIMLSHAFNAHVDLQRVPDHTDFVIPVFGPATGDALPDITHNPTLPHEALVGGWLKPTGLRVFMHPLSQGATFAMNKSADNTRQTVATRVVAPRRHAPATPLQRTLAREFIELFIADVGAEKITLIDEQEYVDNLKRRNQFAAYEESKDAYDKMFTSDRVNAFQKCEVAAKPGKAPRNITVFGPHHQILGGRIIQAFTKLMKRTRWYAFGKTPADLAQAVADLAASAEFLIDQDFSNYDGSVTEFLNEVFDDAMAAVFTPEDLVLVKAWNDTCTGNRIRSSNGVAYDQEHGRGSGEAGTSCKNSFVTAFVSYVALRTEPGKLRTPDEAYAALGIYGGDDGVSSGLSADHAMHTFAALGLTAKIHHLAIGSLIPFLGRFWGPGAWRGDPVSCADIARQLNKLHTTTQNKSVDNMRVAREKALSLFWTDANTPILGAWSRKILTSCDVSLTHDDILAASVDQGLHWQKSQGTPYPNEYQDWMATLVSTDYGTPDTNAYEIWIKDPAADLLCPPHIWKAPDPSLLDLTALGSTYFNGVLIDGDAPPAPPTGVPALTSGGSPGLPDDSKPGPSGSPPGNPAPVRTGGGASNAAVKLKGPPKSKTLSTSAAAARKAAIESDNAREKLRWNALTDDERKLERKAHRDRKALASKGPAPG